MRSYAQNGTHSDVVFILSINMLPTNVVYLHCFVVLFHIVWAVVWVGVYNKREQERARERARERERERGGDIARERERTAAIECRLATALHEGVCLLLLARHHRGGVEILRHGHRPHALAMLAVYEASQ